MRRRDVRKGLSPWWSLSCLLTALFCCFSCASAPGVSHETAGRGQTVAVWELEDVSPGPAAAPVGEILTSRVIETLQRKGVYTVVERTRLLRVLEELRLGSSELADERARLRVGRLMGARFMVFGGYQVVGKGMRLDLRLVEVETGRVLKAVTRATPSSSGVTGWLEAAGSAAGEL